MTEHQWMTIEEFWKATNKVFSRSLITRECRNGTLVAARVAVRLGDRWAIRADALDVLMEVQSGQ